jgi:uncharacterized protein (DUF488 family)
MAALATIGYEKADLEDFIAALQHASVECLIDVRALPLSRKRGFSKTTLSQALEAVGIRYIHLKALGDPKDGRDAARAGRYAEFNRIYCKQLATPAARDALTQAGGAALESKCCLLCYERTPEHCHRKVVAETLAQAYNVTVHHLFVNQSVTDREQRKERRIDFDTSKGGTSPQPAAW